MVAEFIQDMGKVLKVTELESIAEFPDEFEAFEKVCF